MKVLCVVSAILAMSALTQAQKIVQKAPSNLVNCNCQCDNYTYTNHRGEIQGNCKSADQTYGLWCYVDRHDDCADIRYSQSRRDSYGNKRKWSYQACSTPAKNSYQCRNNNFGNNYGNNNNNNNNFNNNYNNGNRRPGNNQNLNRPGALGQLLGLGVRDGASGGANVNDAPVKAGGIQFQ